MLTFLRHGLREWAWLDYHGEQLKAVFIILVTFGFIFLAATLLEKKLSNKESEGGIGMQSSGKVNVYADGVFIGKASNVEISINKAKVGYVGGGFDTTAEVVIKSDNKKQK